MSEVKIKHIICDLKIFKITYRMTNTLRKNETFQDDA